jgi:hypothetical protein
MPDLQPKARTGHAVCEPVPTRAGLQEVEPRAQDAYERRDALAGPAGLQDGGA